MASPTGTALIPTHGSCLPVVAISVSFSDLSIVFLSFLIEDVGFTANLTMISCPEDIPPRIPPELLDRKVGLLFFILISSLFSLPFKLAASKPFPISKPFTAFILIIAEPKSESSFPYIGAPNPTGTFLAIISITAPQLSPSSIRELIFFSQLLMESLSGHQKGFSSINLLSQLSLLIFKFPNCTRAPLILISGIIFLAIAPAATLIAVSRAD